MKFITGLLLWFYRKFFGEPGERVERFVRNLGIFAVGFVIAKVFSLGFQIYVGRTLGPALYGDFSLMLAIAALFFIPMLFGIGTAMVKYVSSEHEDRKKIISTGMTLIVIFAVASFAVLYLLGGILAPIFSVSGEIFFLAIVFAFACAMWTIFKCISQGLLQIKKTALMEFLRALSSFVIVFGLFAFFGTGLFYAFLALFVAYIISCFVMLPEILRMVRKKYIEKAWAKRLLKYGVFSLLAIVSSTILINMDKVFIKTFLTSQAVGIYNAYSLMTTMLTLSLLTIFATVFFPESSMHENKKRVLHQIWKSFKFLPIYYFGIVLTGYIAILLYNYPMNIFYLLMFALASCAMVPFIIHTWFAASIGQSGAKLVSYTILFAATINISLNIYLIPIFGISGAIISTIIAYLIPNLALTYKLKTIYGKNEQNVIGNPVSEHSPQNSSSITE